jgi:hypothetical protein
MNNQNNHTSHINKFEITENYFPTPSNIKINNAIKPLDVQIDITTESIKQITTMRNEAARKRNTKSNTQHKRINDLIDVYDKRIKTEKGKLHNLKLMKLKLLKLKSEKTRKGGKKNRRNRTRKNL